MQGDLGPGTVLPNEAELSLALDVSRTVVREAIKVLAAKGLVESRPKTGTRVLPRDHWNLIDADILAWQLDAGPDAAFFRNLSEVRSLIEPRAAALAAARRTPAEAKQIAALLDELDRVVDDPGPYIRADLALHSAILHATHNELLAQMTDTITTGLWASRAITTRVPGGARSAMAFHRAVVEGICGGDPEGAQAAMDELVTGVAHDLELVIEAEAARGTGRPGVVLAKGTHAGGGERSAAQPGPDTAPEGRDDAAHSPVPDRQTDIARSRISRPRHG